MERRIATYVCVETGTLTQYPLLTDTMPPLERPRLCGQDTRPVRVLARCEPPLPQLPNSVLALFALTELTAHKTAPHVPTSLVEQLLPRVDFAVWAEATELRARLQALHTASATVEATV